MLGRWHSTTTFPLSDRISAVHDQTLAGAALHVSTTGAGSGFAMLDRALPQGRWPASVLIELLLTRSGNDELLLLAPVIAALTSAGKNVIFMAPSAPPSAASMAALGLVPDLIKYIQAEQPADRIWAIQDDLKDDNFGALLCWLPHARPDLLRRLQTATNGCNGLIFVMRPADAQYQSSPAPLRLICRASQNAQLEIEIIKRRGPVQQPAIRLPMSVVGSNPALAAHRRLENSQVSMSIRGPQLTPM